MVRAGIFIGVDQAGDLQKLSDAATGAKRMHEWALEQGLPDKTHAKLLTDAGGKKVRPDDITDAVYELCNGAGVDQLLVYFAGHGINLQRGDRWLLSEAPVKPYAAVNVMGSVELARTCGIPHVVVSLMRVASPRKAFRTRTSRGSKSFRTRAAERRPGRSTSSSPATSDEPRRK
jgi:hypothetical protein